MKKLLLSLLSLLSFEAIINCQTPGNIQVQVFQTAVTGTSPADPNAYTFHENTNTLQGVIVNLPPTEVRTLTLQSNNCRLKFKNPPAFMQSVELNWDNQGFQSVHSGSSISETGWLTPPSSFMTIGIHNVKVKFLVLSNVFSREYSVFVTQPSQRFFLDGTASSLTTGNTLTLWDNPTCPDAEPLLLSEGFDPANSRFAEYYRFRGDVLTQRMFELGYKVYVLNYNLAGQNMQNNAAVYIAALRYLSQINGGRKVVAAGMSMGGVITRYALAKGEAGNLNLPVSMFLSLDAPQQGATIDKPFQQFIIDHEDANNPNPSIHSPVSRQLLVNHVLESDHASHNSFYNELNALNSNGHPHKIPSIGVAFSNNTPNPNIGRTWLEIHTPVKVEKFNVTNEWSQAGSFLPRATTNIDAPLPLWVRLILPGTSTADFVRLTDPTFIPYNSALDITNGISKFPIRIEANAASAHDEVPPEVVTRLGNQIELLGVPSTVASNETYNFTSLQGNRIRQSTTVLGNLVVNQSGASGSSFNPQPQASVSQFDLTTRPCDPITINVESNGRLEVGATDGNGDLNASLTLKLGDVLRIKSNATLRVRANSQIIIGSGSRLIIENGAILNFVGAESKIIIKQGGELIINGSPIITGSGHFRFEKDNIFTLNANATLTGVGRTTPLIKIASDATITVTRPFVWTVNDATILHETGAISSTRCIWLRNNAILKATNVVFDNQTTGFLSTVSSFIEGDDPDFRALNQTSYDFKNCRFQNAKVGNTAIRITTPFANRKEDHRNVFLYLTSSEFIDCKALLTERNAFIFIRSCTLTNANLDIRHALRVDISNTSIRATTAIRGDFGIKLTDIREAIISFNTLIDNRNVGVDASAAFCNTLYMSYGATIQKCGTAIILNGGIDATSGVNVGLLKLYNCGRMIENDMA